MFYQSEDDYNYIAKAWVDHSWKVIVLERFCIFRSLEGFVQPFLQHASCLSLAACPTAGVQQPDSCSHAQVGPTSESLMGKGTPLGGPGSHSFPCSQGTDLSGTEHHGSSYGAVCDQKKLVKTSGRCLGRERDMWQQCDNVRDSTVGGVGAWMSWLEAIRLQEWMNEWMNGQISQSITGLTCGNCWKLLFAFLLYSAGNFFLSGPHGYDRFFSHNYNFSKFLQL